MNILERLDANRTSANTITEEAKESLAAYYGSTLLYEWIYPFSRKENAEKLENRRFLTVKHYRNFPREISAQYVEGVYRTKQIRRSYDDELFDEYLAGQYDTWFRKNIAAPSLFLPELYVVVSLPRIEDEPNSRLDEIELGLQPYPVVVYPQFVRAFSMDSENNIEWITFKNGNLIEYYDEEIYATFQEKQSADKQTEYIATGDPIQHGFKRCPVVRIAYEENVGCMDVSDSMPVGHAFMRDVVSLSIANLQYTSMLVEMGYFNLMYTLVTGEDTAKGILQNGMGNGQFIAEKTDEQNVTRYLEMPTMQMSELKDIVFEKNPAAVFHAARLRDRSATVAQSGLAKAFDMVPETGALSAISEFWSDADYRIVDLMAEAWLGAGYDSAEVTWSYPVTFDVRSPQETMSSFVEFISGVVDKHVPYSETAVREMMKNVTRTMLPDAEQDVLQVIYDEIDAAQFGAPVETNPSLTAGKTEPVTPMNKTGMVEEPPMPGEME